MQTLIEFVGDVLTKLGTRSRVLYLNGTISHYANDESTTVLQSAGISVNLDDWFDGDYLNKSCWAVYRFSSGTETVHVRFHGY